jgi:hypothetical protein
MQIQDTLDRRLAVPLEVTMVKKGREYNHLEDLVLFGGAAGMVQAADIIQQIASGDIDLSIKWDGKLAVYYGRDETGRFGLSTIGGWRQNDPSISPAHIKHRIETSGPGEDWRKPMAQSLAAVFPLLDASVPADFRGYVKGDVLFAPRMIQKSNTQTGIHFTPNQVTYAVDSASSIGKRVAQADVGLALHTYFDVWGSEISDNIIADSMVQSLNTNKVMALGQTYVSKTPAVDTLTIRQIRMFACDHSGAIDSIVAGRKGLADMYNILYTYVNQLAKKGKVNSISTLSLLNWLPSSKVSQGKQARIRDMAQHESSAMDAVFQAVRLVMNAKNNIIWQLDAAETDVNATTNGIAGGEGYVSFASKIKLVPRHNWIPK